MIDEAPGGGGHMARAAPVRIIDFPRWTYRGLMMDTARAYVPVSQLKQHLDAMAWSKLK